MFTGLGGGGPFGAPALALARRASLSSSEFSISSLEVMVRALPPRLPTGDGVLESLDLVARSDMALYARRERGGSLSCSIQNPVAMNELS